MFLAGLI